MHALTAVFFAVAVAASTAAAAPASTGGAQARKDPAAKLEAVKAKRLAKLDQRIADLQKQRDCVADAKDLPSLRQCAPAPAMDASVRACIKACKGSGSEGGPSSKP